MTRHDIISLPNPALRQRSQRVGAFDQALANLCHDMEDATLDWEAHRPHEVGVALAAPQINVHKRVVIIRNDFDNKSDKSFLPLVNPKVIRHEGQPVLDYEGCLSVPNIYGQVRRYPKIKVKAQDLNGQEFRLTAEGFLARVIQHEIDHTNGMMFVDYLRSQLDSFFRLDDDGQLVAIKEAEIAKQADVLWD